MNQTERVADGKRRFFPAAGKVSDVLLRGVKSHHDMGLEMGRDYEVEVGGVSLRHVPPAGSTVIILTGDRVIELQPTVKVVERIREVPVERIVHLAAERSVDPPAVLAPTVPASLDELDLAAFKTSLVLSIKETSDQLEHDQAWQDELARRTALLWAAETVEGVQLAFQDIEAFFRGGT